LLTQQGVFCDQFGLASGKVSQRPQEERSGVRRGPDDEAVMERLKAKTYQLLEKNKNPMHRVRYSFVKLSR